MTATSAIPEKPVCGICGNNTGRVVETTERMFGMGGCFHYFECENCGCVQLLDVPADLSVYYPADRYPPLLEFFPAPAQTRTGMKLALFRLRNGYALFGRPLFIAPLAKLRPPADDVKPLEPFFRHATKRSMNCRVLDVGSGKGQLLEQIARVGFQDVHGVDPFLTDTIAPQPGITLHKCFLKDLDVGKFDLIISQHSFEHVTDPEVTLQAMAQRLAPGGICRIEVPVAGSRIWQEYGADWIELDPPRHINLFTRKSMKILAEKAGLKITQSEQVEIPFGFFGSELYRRGHTLWLESERRYIRPDEAFTAAETASFAERANAANADGVAGRMVFWLQRLDEGT